MNQHTDKIAPVQNIGLTDRMIRFFGGGALLAWGVFSLMTVNSTPLPNIAILLSIYPLMTTIMAWDPFYQLFNARSCSISEGRNSCVTFPYEVDSALGHAPKPKHDYDHSLSGSHH